MSQNKNEILKDIALSLGGTVTKKDNDTNELLSIIRDNVSEGGSAGGVMYRHTLTIPSNDNTYGMVLYFDSPYETNLFTESYLVTKLGITSNLVLMQYLPDGSYPFYTIPTKKTEKWELGAPTGKYKWAYNTDPEPIIHGVLIKQKFGKMSIVLNESDKNTMFTWHDLGQGYGKDSSGVDNLEYLDTVTVVPGIIDPLEIL